MADLAVFQDDAHAAIAAALGASKASADAALEASKLATDAALEASKIAASLAASHGKVSWQVIAQAGIWLVSALLAYSAINVRLQVLEVKYDRISQDIVEVKSDVKQLLRLQK